MSWNKWMDSLPGRRLTAPSRRAFLGGAASLIALPFLPSLRRVGGESAVAAESPVRLVFWYVPNGMWMPDWTPVDSGRDYTLSRILQPLAPVRDELLVLTNLANRAGQDTVPGDHARGTGSFLTCTQVAREGIGNAVSADQMVAQARGGETLFPSLELGIEAGGSAGSCDSGYSCAYSRSIAWAGPYTPLPKIVHPRLAFERLFGGLDVGVSEQERQRRLRYRASVLDQAVDDVVRLQGRLGSEDQLRLDEYLTGLRELERRLEQGDSGTCEHGAPPPSFVDWPERARLMSEITVLALRCDLTRIVTFMLGNAGSNLNFDFIGAPGAHHELSHHQGDPVKGDKLATIGTWEMARFAELLERMREVDEGEGTLLDHSLVMCSSEIGDGNSHAHHQLPVLLAGRGGDLTDPGRHVVFPEERPLADLYIAMMSAAGVEVDGFGQDGTGPLEGLR